MKKKIMGIILCGILAVSLLSACGTDNDSKNSESTSTPSSNESGSKSDTDKKNDGNTNTQDGSATSDPSEVKPKGDDQDAANTEKPTLQTADEAKNDSDVIQKEIEDIAELIELGEYDDALMQIKALSTKNLTEEQKATIQEVIEFLEGKTAKGLSD